MAGNEGNAWQAATPWNFLQQWASDNPRQASFLFGGVACFASVALIATFGVDLENRTSSVAYLLGVAMALVVCIRIINNDLILDVLSWFATLLFILWVLVFIAYNTLGFSSTVRQQLSCAISPWRDCYTNTNMETDDVAQPGLPSQVLPPLQAQSVRPQDYQVFVQFAGSLSRDTIKAMMKKLGEDQKWSMQGALKGGERTAAAAGASEVRYGTDDEAAARALAMSVQQFDLTGRKVEVKQTPGLAKGQLEVWISR